MTVEELRASGQREQARADREMQQERAAQTNVADDYWHDVSSRAAKGFVNMTGMFAQAPLAFAAAHVPKLPFASDDTKLSLGDKLVDAQNSVAGWVGRWNRDLDNSIQWNGDDATQHTAFTKTGGVLAEHALPPATAALVAAPAAKKLLSLYSRGASAASRGMGRLVARIPRMSWASKPVEWAMNYVTLSNTPARLAFTALKAAPPALRYAPSFIQPAKGTAADKLRDKLIGIRPHLDKAEPYIDMITAPTVPALYSKNFIGPEGWSYGFQTLTGSLLGNPAAYSNKKWLVPRYLDLPVVSGAVTDYINKKPDLATGAALAQYIDLEKLPDSDFKDFLKQSQSEVMPSIKNYVDKSPLLDKLMAATLYRHSPDKQEVAITRAVRPAYDALKPETAIGKYAKRTLVELANQFNNTTGNTQL